MFKFLLNLKWGLINPNTPLKMLISNNWILNEPKMPFIKAHHFWFWFKPVPKMALQIMEPFWIFEQAISI